MNKYQRLAHEFQNVPGAIYAPTPTEISPLPGWAVDLWHRLITEEHTEWQEAIAKYDVVAVAHEQCDLLYVLYGAATWMGLKIPRYTLNTPMIQSYNIPIAAQVEIAVNDALMIISEPTRFFWAAQKALGLLHTNPPRRVKLWPVYSAVHKANMAKYEGGKWIDGKLQKPDKWTPADIAAVLKAQGINV